MPVALGIKPDRYSCQCSGPVVLPEAQRVQTLSGGHKEEVMADAPSPQNVGDFVGMYSTSCDLFDRIGICFILNFWSERSQRKPKNARCIWKYWLYMSALNLISREYLRQTSRSMISLICHRSQQLPRDSTESSFFPLCLTFTDCCRQPEVTKIRACTMYISTLDYVAKYH